MKKEIVKEELRWLLDAINEQFETIWRYEKEIPQLEFDILYDNVHKMFENMTLLQKLIREEVTPTHEEAQTPVQKMVPLKVDEALSQPEPLLAPAVTEEVFEAPRVTIRFEKPDIPTGEVPVPPVVKETKKGVGLKKAQQASTLDLFAEEEPAFSIKLKEAREKTFGEKIPSERITNLKSAITINDKFMFINELFEGDLRDYNETIETLNGFQTLMDAGNFMELLVRKNYWNTSSPAFQKLKELVERRF